MSTKFKRKKEDFVCEKCGKAIKGDGYTDHCSYCLWSKHVDINPGDRAEACGGLMAPISIEGSTEHYVLTYKCLKCGFERKNRPKNIDNIDIIVELARKQAQKAAGL